MGLQQNLLKDNVPNANIINVVRGSALPSFARALKRKNFSPIHRLDVCFVDVAQNAEGAIDNGGPTREFFRLLLTELSGSEVFEGPDHSKHLRLSTNGNTPQCLLMFCSKLKYKWPQLYCNK